MKKAKWFLGLASVAVLAACGNSKQESADVTKSNYPVTAKNEGTVVGGGKLRYGIVSDNPLAGVFSTTFYQNAYDAEVLAFTDESLFRFDENYKVTDSGIGKLSFDIDKKTVTVSIRKDVKWSDGQPLTIDDYIYSFEIIGHKDYKGIRYSSDMKNIVGMEEYHNGKAETISGITKNDDYSATFQVKEITPSIQQSGGFWSSATPKHTLKGIPVADMPASDAVRKNPVGLGAFRVKSVVSGEAVELEANEYYWQGKPKLEGAVLTVVSSTNSADEFKAGNYDLMGVPQQTAIVDSFSKLNNVKMVGKWSNVISYLGFKLGTWDKATETIVPNPDAKMANKSLRQAMGYALDLDKFSESFYGTLRVRANSLITPNFKTFRDGTLEGYKYDVEKAKKLLDEAGYKDVDGDGLREDPKGQKLTINMAFMSGGEAEAQAQYYLQSWKAVGLNVQLTNGRLIEFNTFYKMIEEDDPNIDIYSAAWGLGNDPEPNGVWGTDSTNYTRYTSPEYKAILDKFLTKEVLDETKQVAAFKEWQKFANEEAFALPLQYRMSLTAVNNRVKEYDATVGDSNTWNNLHKLELTAQEPVKSTAK